MCNLESVAPQHACFKIVHKEDKIKWVVPLIGCQGVVKRMKCCKKVVKVVSESLVKPLLTTITNRNNKLSESIVRNAEPL